MSAAKRRRSEFCSIVPIIAQEQLPATRALRRAAEDSVATGQRSLNTLLKDTSNAIHGLREQTTVYGPLVDEVEVVGEEGSFPLLVVRPQALLRMLTERSDHYGKFLTDCLASGHGSVILYSDKTVPGNALRPDKGRAFFAVYWTLAEFPAWFRKSHDHGWFCLANAFVDDTCKAGVTHSNLLATCLRMFWPTGPDTWNFDSVGIHILRSGRPIHIRLKFHGILADDEGLWEAASWKTASSYKLCLACRNIVGLVEPEDLSGSYLKHVSEPDESTFDYHSQATWAEMVQTLNDARTAGMGPTAFGKLQTDLGLKYDPRSIVFDAELLAMVDGPNGYIWDWMHNLVSSSGLAQFVVNGFANDLSTVGLPAADLDRFTFTVKLPQCHTKLHRAFWQERTVRGQGKHIRAFASEVLTAIQIAVMFCDAVLRPMEALERHCVILRKLGRITDTLLLGDRALQFLDQLDADVKELHVLFLAMYGWRPKLHYFRHCIRSFRQKRVVVSCFVTERKHRFLKSIAAFTFNHLGKALLAHFLNEILKRFCDPSHFKRCRLMPPTKALPGIETLFEPLGFTSEIAYSSAMKTTTGSFRKKDLVVWKFEGSAVSLGEAQLFVQATVSGQEHGFAFVHEYEHRAGAMYSVKHDHALLVHAEHLVRCVGYQQMDDVVRVMLPSVM